MEPTIKIPLTSQVAGWLVTISTFFGAVGLFLISAEPANTPFGWDARDTGLLISWIATFADFAVVALRRDAVPLPFVRSGVGLEPKPNTATLTIESTVTPPEGGQ